MQVCTKEDGYIYELFEFTTRWVVTLSNGERVFQDDNRPGIEQPSAWIRLGQYVQANKLSITDMKIQFRSTIIPVNDGPVDGFFFSKSVLGSPGMDKTLDFYIAGTLKNGILTTKSYQIPEFDPTHAEMELRDPDKAGLCLIRNYNANNS
jgi:hypothetical protein